MPFTVPKKGIGLPDYSREIGRSIQRPGILLKNSQILTYSGLVFSNIPSFFSWVKSPLAAGASMHVVDMTTGLPYPYTTPAGYKHTLIQRSVYVSEDVRLDDYLEGQLGFSSIITAGSGFFKQDVVGMSTTMFDPTAISAHTVDNIITNLGSGSLVGSFVDVGILEEVGTEPLPSTKVVQCKYCSHQETVPRDASTLKCPKCEKITMYFVAEAQKKE